jgi:multiple sugar transport system substrate-binding protein
MKRRSTVHTAVIAAATGALLLSGCSGGSTAASGPTDLTMTVWTSDTVVISAYEKMADEFRKTHPELGKFTVESVPYDSYLARITTQLSGGDSPDLGWMVDTSVPGLVKAGALVDVKKTFESTEGYNFDEIPANMLEVVSYDDGIYGYPFANNAQPIIYNADMFAAAGLENPAQLAAAGNWTWPVLREQAKKLVDAGVATYGFDIPQFQYKTINQLTVLFNGFDADVWPGATSCGYNSPEGVDAMTFLHDLIFTDKSFPGPGNVSSFPTGDTAMYVGAPSTLANLADASFSYGLAPQPDTPDGPAGLLAQATMVAFSSGANVDLSSKLLAYLTNPENSAELGGYFPPPRPSALTPELLTDRFPGLTSEAVQTAIIDALDTARARQYPVSIPQLETAITPVMDGLWQPNADVAAVLDKVCATADPILNK